MNIIAMVAGYIALSLALAALACIALAPKPLVEDDQTTPEAPFLPPPVLHAMSMRDRLGASRDLRERRARWATHMEAERIVYDVERGVAP